MGWWLPLAEQGVPNAQNRVAAVYEFGLGGVKQDHLQAYMWSIRAKSQDEDAPVFKNKSLTPHEIAEAKRRAAVWKPKPFSCPARGVGVESKRVHD